MLAGVSPTVYVVDEVTHDDSIRELVLATQPVVIICRYTRKRPLNFVPALAEEKGLICLAYFTGCQHVVAVFPANDFKAVRNFLNYRVTGEQLELRAEGDRPQIYASYTGIDADFWKAYITDHPVGTSFIPLTDYDVDFDTLCDELLAKHRLATLIKNSQAMFVQLPPGVGEQ